MIRAAIFGAYVLTAVGLFLWGETMAAAGVIVSAHLLLLVRGRRG
jgi:hypothetical protein